MRTDPADPFGEVKVLDESPFFSQLFNAPVVVTEPNVDVLDHFTL